ncbi:MAG: hypothetical protein RMI89_02960 [Gloeomargarita sp. SKYBB_i_bin120]|nr:hypothetical protein [Gloeomargarita sp. SKYG98]MCS7291921.1 hypothetical protein [Gloeomargarita sp. SKYB120]MDW8177481.1 hypothetical protein [Gloeomargarita sp. SKYBB_i_bin120]
MESSIFPLPADVQDFVACSLESLAGQNESPDVDTLSKWEYQLSKLAALLHQARRQSLVMK